jgi:protein-tyrosine phosphatase
MVRVLFVCLGNICRSPMAEAVLRHYVKEAGLSAHIEIDSAGIGDWHTGEPPHEGTRRKLDEAGISYEGIRARQIRKEDLEKFDYVIGMDNSNMERLYRLAGGKKPHLHRFVDFIPNTTYDEVPDPWYTGDFEETYQLVTAGCRELLKRIIQEHSLPGKVQ